MVPLTCPGVTPVMDVPVDTPRSPATAVGPVLVTAEPASTANEAATPRTTGGSAATADPAVTVKAISASTAAEAVATTGRSRARGWDTIGSV
jgi:hypothetical protein